MLKVILFSAIAGIVGTSIGGLLAILIKKPTNRLMHILFTIASGVMLGISFLHLLPQAIEISGLLVTCAGLIAGVILLLFIQHRVMDQESILMKMTDKTSDSTNNYSSLGMVLFLSIALHNLPEGLAIGAGTELSIGLTTALSIGIHNIPEGTAVALPLKLSGKNAWQVLLYCVFTGLPTLFGGILGYLFGQINEVILALCLSLAAGAMIAVVFVELVPKTQELSNPKHGNDSAFAVTAGIIISILMLAL